MKQSTFDAGRVRALSDGVFAIAMTLLVLNLKLPDLATGLGRDAFVATLLEQGPRFASWLLSFAILCRLWISQHALLAEGDTRSRGFVGWTFLFLGAVSFIPFPTSLLSEHHDQALSVVIFSATLAVAGIALAGMRRVWIRHRPANGRPNGAERFQERPVVILLATAAVSSGLAVFSPRLGALIWVAYPVVAPLTSRRAASVPDKDWRAKEFVMIRKADRYLPAALFLMILSVLLNTGCGSSKYTVTFSEYTLPFVTVREADFRCGPLELPLTDASRRKISTFLQRGGNWGNNEMLDFNTPTYYEELLDLLSDPTFLHSSNFRQENQIDQVSEPLKPWFHSPVIYQIVDGTQKHPVVPNPICISDGKYWWIFYLGERLAESGDLEITRVLINAPLSRTIKHYQKIKKTASNAPAKDLSGKSQAQIYADARQAPQKPQDMHAALLRQLVQVAHVRLVARLEDARLGHPAVHGVRVFIPDVHLLSKNRVADFKYATNYVHLLTDIAGELVTFKQSASGTGMPVTVYQMGDFVDLWRERPMYFKMKKVEEKTELHYQKVLEDHEILSRRLFGPELGTRRVLGNHDFDTHELETCIDAELRYYFPYDPEAYPIGVALHGDIFDSRERRLSERLEHWGVYHFGPKVEQKVYDLEELTQKIVQDHGDNDYKDHIRLPEPASLGKSAHVRDERTLLEEELARSRFNVRVAGDPSVPKGLFQFLPEAERVTAIINDQTGWDVRFVVIGHTHHARIVVDERAEKDGGSTRGFFALVDCGAWLEEGNLDGEIVRNAQIGVLYDNDVRIYQFSPKQ